MFWSCTRSSLHVYMLCSLGKHLLHSHMESYVLSQKHRCGRLMINHKRHACLSHHRSVMLSICVLMFWGILSSIHVSVCLQGRICTISLTHTLRHYYWNSNDQISLSQSDHHPIIDSINCHQNSAEAPNKPFEAALPISSSINHPSCQPKRSLTWLSTRDWLPSKIAQRL